MVAAGSPAQRAAGAGLAERRAIAVAGTVQGVGFRPFVHRLALRHGLGGFVRNQAAEVHIEAEGEPEALDAFVRELAAAPPPLARISRLDQHRLAPRGERRFRIVPSARGAGGDVAIAPDTAPCRDCLAELADPGDRRHRYPFLNCTRCGPRLTVVLALPYDRARTTMAGFALCADCRREYDDPADRRFHAQPTACPACGPALEWRPASGRRRAGAAALEAAARAVEAGGIVAVKGVGGFHLACDAARDGAVAELRRRKCRPGKPLALLVADVAAARRLCRVPAAAAALLASPRRPIVLLPRRPGAAVAPEVAPGIDLLGLTLPPSPLHLLLAERLARPLVLTSANASDEPTLHRDEDALALLGPVADGVLGHDRPIALRCDDSVARWTRGGPLLVRRARGWAPEPIELAAPAPVPVLALGGQQKAAVCLFHGRRAVLSPHVGDLAGPAAAAALGETVDHLRRLLGVRPGAVACDLHPDFASTRLAERIAAEEGIPLVAVQHHHAHAAAVLAEHGVVTPALALVLDGTGLGTDGAVWGGELLALDGGGCERLGHLEPVRLPGGERAVREPWRMALAWLHRAWEGRLPDLPLPPLDRLRLLDADRRRLLLAMLERGPNAPWTTSAGRLFDAVAALAGLRQEADFEGQPAMELEALAGDRRARPLPVPLDEPPGRPLVLRLAPAVRRLAEDLAAGSPRERIAARFHATLAAALVAAAGRARERSGLGTVALAGGCFQNARLLAEVEAGLAAAGFRVLVPRQAPPNDGGLALGQAAVAAARLDSC